MFAVAQQSNPYSGCAGHIPRCHDAVGVPPEDIDTVIAIQITNNCDLPRRVYTSMHRAIKSALSIYQTSDPKNPITLPENVSVAIQIKVSNGYKLAGQQVCIEACFLGDVK